MISESHAEVVGIRRRVMVAAPSYLQRAGAPQSPNDLAAHCVVAATGVPHLTEWRTPEGAPLKPDFSPRLQATTMQVALDAAIAGWGLARVLSYVAAPHVTAGRLRYLLEAYEPSPAPIHVLHAHGGRPPAKVRLLVDALVSGLRADKSLSLGT